MVQILIHGPPLWPQDASGTSAYPDELFLLELQGTLETTEQGDEALSGQTMGTIEWPKEKNKGPILRIGHHRLEGKLVPLPQPFAVIRKQDPPYNPEDEEDDENNGMDLDSETNTRRRRSGYGGLVGFTSSAPPSSTAVTVPTSPSKHIENGGKTTDYDVLTIIRYKYLFKNRPEISVSEELRGSNSLIGANRGKQ